MNTFGGVLATVDIGYGPGRLTWSPDGRLLAAGYGVLGFGDDPNREPIVVVDTAAAKVRWRTEAGYSRCVDLLFSPDGSRLAAAFVGSEQDNAVVLLDSETGREVWRRAGPAPWRLRFSPDGRCLAVVDDAAVRLLDPSNGRQLFDLGVPDYLGGDTTFTRDSRWYLAAVGGQLRLVDTRDATTIRWTTAGVSFRARFTPDESQLVVINDAQAQTLDAATGQIISTTPLERPSVGIPFIVDTSMELSPDLRHYAHPAFHTMALWSVADGRRVCPDTPTSMSLDPQVGFSPDGRLLAFAPDENGGLSVLDPATGGIVLSYQAGGPSLAFDPAAGRLATTAGSGIAILDLGAQISQRSFGGPITGVAVTGEGIPMVAAVSKDQTLVVFQAETGAVLLNYANSRSINALEFGPGGESYATASVDGYLELRRIPSGRPSALSLGRSLNALVYDPARPDRVVTGGEDKKIRSFTLTASGVTQDWELAPAGPVRLVAAAPDGRWFAAATADHFVVVVTASGTEVCRFEHRERIAALSFGAFVATAGEDGRALLIEPGAGRLVDHVDHPRLLTAVAASPDGALLVTADDAGTVRYFDTTSGTKADPVREVGYPERVRALLFHPTDQRLAILAADAPLARIVDPATGAESVRLGHPDLVGELVFSHDGGLLATACADNTVRVFPGRWT